MTGFGTLTVTFGLGTLITGRGMAGFGMLMTGLGISIALVLVVVAENRITKPATIPEYLRTTPSNQR